MTVTPDVEVEIRRLYFAEHWKRGTIATQLGLHDDVVKRVVGPLGRAARAQNDASVLESFLVFITETLERYPRLRSTRIYDMLCGRGYTGSIRTLRRHIATVRPLPKSEVFLRVEPLIASFTLSTSTKLLSSNSTPTRIRSPPTMCDARDCQFFCVTCVQPAGKRSAKRS